MTETVLFLGAGYVARATIPRANGAGWRTIGTSRAPDNQASLKALGCEALTFDGQTASDELTAAVGQATALVVSIAPDRTDAGARDPVLDALGGAIRSSGTLRHVTYLSTIGVYGDFEGAWIDETAPTKPSSSRAQARVTAETAWRAAAAASDGWLAAPHSPSCRNLRAGPQPDRPCSRGDRARDHQTRPGLQPHSCRRHRDGHPGRAGRAWALRRLQRHRQRTGATRGRDLPRGGPDRRLAPTGHRLRGRRSIADGEELLCRRQTRSEYPPRQGPRCHSDVSELSRRAWPHSTAAEAN
jgi:hypothetical protein